MSSDLKSVAVTWNTVANTIRIPGIEKLASEYFKIRSLYSRSDLFCIA